MNILIKKNEWKENFDWLITVRRRWDRRFVVEFFDIDRLILIRILASDDEDDDIDEGEPIFASVMAFSE